MDLWNEDVFEVFLWTDERYPVYFEYQISPLNRELPIIVPNFGGKFLGWRPWHYEGGPSTRKNTSIRGGPKESRAAIEGWRAEFFIPYTLLNPLQNVPPKPGTVWRANFYRMDHDGGKRTQWDWAPVGESFHEYQKFGELRVRGSLKGASCLCGPAGVFWKPRRDCRWWEACSRQARAVRGRRGRRSRLLPRPGRAPLHQRRGDLHGHDRVAHAAGSHGGDQLRLPALRDARRAPRQGGRAHRHAGPRRGARWSRRAPRRR